jgi:membrane-associated phospholipid phosphatase
MDILYQIGNNGPIILILISWYVLWEYKNLFFYYNVGMIINVILNIILKGIIQEPRPMFDDKKVHLLKTHAKHYFFQNGIPFQVFGMPSGHAQAVFFSTIFIYLSLKHNNLTLLYLIISLISCYQRVKFSFHTITQVIIGAIVGSNFGYIMYRFAREKLKGKIRERRDDNALIY